MANLKDFATGTVSVAPNPATTGNTATLQAGEAVRFPAPPFYATAHPDYQLPTLDNAEKILVTAVDTTTNVITFTRAQGPTTAKSIAVGWRISNAVFKDDLFTGSVVTGETPTGLIDGANTAFTVTNAFTAGSLRVYLNGQRLRAGAANDYTENASLTGFTMNYAPGSTDTITVDYMIGNDVYMNGTNTRINDEEPTGLVNGSNAAFTTKRPYISGTLEVYVNGSKQALTLHVTENSPSAGTFTLDTAPPSGSIVRVTYLYAASVGGNAQTLEGVTLLQIKQALYPVGSLYFNADNATNPGTLLGFGTWSAYAEGRVPVGKAASGTFATAGGTMGAETHQLTQLQSPWQTSGSEATGYGLASTTAFQDRVAVTRGGNIGAAHNIIQPSIVVYIWRRTA